MSPRAAQRSGTVRCSYCKKPCDGSKRDELGESILKLSLPICDECDEDFATEPGPWDGWSK